MSIYISEASLEVGLYIPGPPTFLVCVYLLSTLCVAHMILDTRPSCFSHEYVEKSWVGPGDEGKGCIYTYLLNGIPLPFYLQVHFSIIYETHSACTIINFADLCNRMWLKGGQTLLFGILMFAGTKFCVFGPIRRNIKAPANVRYCAYDGDNLYHGTRPWLQAHAAPPMSVI